jgi:hypothetical protein
MRVKNSDRGIWTVATGWRLADELEFPRRRAPDSDVLGSIVDVAVDATERIYVLDGSEKSILIFDDAGRRVRTVGREGAGPGEFRDPGALRWTPDGELLVLDFQNARYTAFDTSGTYVRDHRRMVHPKAVPWPGGFAPSGQLYDLALAPPVGKEPPRVVLVRLDAAFAPEDSFPIPAYERPRFELRAGGATIRAGVPFAPSMHWRLDALRGHMWSGLSDRYELTRLALERDSVLVAEREYTPVRVTREEREQAIQSLEGFKRQGGRIDPSRIPNTKPAFMDFWLDPDGFVWVLPTVPPGEGFGFDVFGPDGSYLGRVEGARRFFPMLVTHRAVYGMREYAEGTQHVVRYRILRPGEDR